ncbi:MAG: NADH-quinone oxidoreductase subunit A [Candidatus Bathyarchaeota archaeon]|jgi:NADH:ubiquinone oxidoreductase subunit 3 (subunit A)
MLAEILSSLPFVIIVTIAIAVIIYVLGSRIATKGKISYGKTASYTCGEELSPQEFKMNVEEFFIYAVYFLVFDVLIFVLAMSFAAPGMLVAIYTVIVLIAVTVLTYLVR